jgi:hypothetical protein
MTIVRGEHCLSLNLDFSSACPILDVSFMEVLRRFLGGRIADFAEGLRRGKSRHCGPGIRSACYSS